MKARVSVAMALALVCALLVLPAPALATPPETLQIHAEMWMMPDGVSAVGWFSISGPGFGDGGGASEVFHLADDTLHGIKTLVGQQGTIALRFQARSEWSGPTTAIALGRFVIVSGTGAYERLHGTGTTEATLDLGCFGPDCPPNILADYTGTGHFD